MPRRALSRSLPPRSTIVTSPRAWEPAGIATRSPTRTSRVTRATTSSSTRAFSLVIAVSTWRPSTESVDTTRSTNRGAGGALGSTDSGNAAGAMGAAATACTGLGSSGAGAAAGRASGIDARASCVTRGALETGAGRVRGASGAVRAASGRALARGAAAGAAGAAFTGALSAVPRFCSGRPEAFWKGGATGVSVSEMTASDCSTPPVATSATGAAVCGARAGRLAINAPAAPTVMHDAATTATVLVRISMMAPGAGGCDGPPLHRRVRSKGHALDFERFRANYHLSSGARLFSNEDLSPAVVKPSGLFRAADPRRLGGRRRLRQRIEQRAGVGMRDDDAAVPDLDEPFGDAAVELRDQRIVEAADVQQPARLAVHAELRPRDHLADLLEGAEPSRHRDKRIRQRRHRRLAFVHRVDDTQIGQRAVRELARHERGRNDADGVAAGRTHRVGNDAHQPDGAAPEHQAK